MSCRWGQHSHCWLDKQHLPLHTTTRIHDRLSSKLPNPHGGKTLPIPTAARAEMAWKFSTLTTYLAKSLKPTPSLFRILSRRPSTTPSYFSNSSPMASILFLSLGLGLLLFSEFWGPLNTIASPVLFNFEPGGIGPDWLELHGTTYETFNFLETNKIIVLLDTISTRLD